MKYLEKDRDDDFDKIGMLIKGQPRFALQKFRAGRTLNPRFERETTYTDEEFELIKDKMKRMKVPDTGGYNQHLQDALELENMILIAELVTKSALIREESRGAHYRADYPDRRDEWKKSIVLNQNKGVKFLKR